MSEVWHDYRTRINITSITNNNVYRIPLATNGSNHSNTRWGITGATFSEFLKSWRRGRGEGGGKGGGEGGREREGGSQAHNISKLDGYWMESKCKF